TFVDGSLSDSCFDVALDTQGNIYLIGETFSGNFPTTAGAFNTMMQATRSGWLTKISASGSTLLYSTYFGSTGSGAITSGYAVTTDSAGNAYVTGSTGGGTFPTTSGVLRTTNAGSA